MFIEIRLAGTDFYWGYESIFAPSVGDIAFLYFEEPDTEPTGEDCVTATVTERQFIVQDDGDGECELWVTMTTEDHIPEQMVPDSPAWPSQDWSDRKDELNRKIDRITSR